MTFLSQIVEGHDSPMKGSRFHHPKKVTKNCQVEWYFRKDSCFSKAFPFGVPVLFSGLLFNIRRVLLYEKILSFEWSCSSQRSSSTQKTSKGQNPRLPIISPEVLLVIAFGMFFGGQIPSWHLFSDAVFERSGKKATSKAIQGKTNLQYPKTWQQLLLHLHPRNLT